jgi:hypothetical protein
MVRRRPVGVTPLSGPLDMATINETTASTGTAPAATGEAFTAVNQCNTGFALYNAYSPYGISGGFYYGKLSFTF